MQYKWGRGSWEAGSSLFPQSSGKALAWEGGWYRARAVIEHPVTGFGYGAVNWHFAALGTVDGIYEVAQQGQALGQGCFESAWGSCEPAVGFPLRPREPGRHEQQLLQQWEPRIHGSERHGRHVQHVQHEWWLGNVTNRWLLVTSFLKNKKTKN